MKDEKVFTLVDELLAEQQTLSAVETFSRLHDRDVLPAMARHYKALLPAAPPGPGEQYAFEVNLDACTGCKACVSACHSLNGLDDDEAWRDVGLLLGGQRNDAYQQVVTTACHHCADPGCMNGCPVGAYEKEADTGIVRHLDDQCIGCQYCVLKCPYDVPKYSERLGIVRKCDMCVGRLREGEAPACVQACPTSAISIRVVKKEDLTFTANTTMLPGAFDSSYTKPSTLYRTTKTMPKNTKPADAKALRLEHAHWPLVWMMVLTQMSAGMFAVQAALTATGVLPLLPLVVYAATAVLLVGLSVSVLHLGRPLGAWRFFIGLRTSWMSREILGFSLFAGAAQAACAVVFVQQYAELVKLLPSGAAVFLGSHVTPLVNQWLSPYATPLLTVAVVAGAGLVGLAGVFTSVMIYVDTHRPFWNAGLTNGKFFGTSLLLGLTAVGAFGTDKLVLVAALVVRVLMFAWENAMIREAFDNETSPWHASARVLKLKLDSLMNVRDGMFLLFLMMSIPALAMSGVAVSFWGCGMLLAAIAAQIMERCVFFVASMGPRMTGGYKA
ncbi:MAG: molybdopterin oxidoreductase [Verrucomicrobiaceae bacterium]|nr:molybdopterin oxidoreductase [Verrucomicrobiaceae bacterium]